MVKFIKIMICVRCSDSVLFPLTLTTVLWHVSAQWTFGIVDRYQNVNKY